MWKEKEKQGKAAPKSSEQGRWEVEVDTNTFTMGNK